MANKPVILRDAARRDVDAHLDDYLTTVGEKVALRFVPALEAALQTMAIHRGAGSPRYAHEQDLPGLRSRGLDRFPFRVFYLEREDVIDVWRVLDARRDIPAWLQDP